MKDLPTFFYNSEIDTNVFSSASNMLEKINFSYRMIKRKELNDQSISSMYNILPISESLGIEKSIQVFSNPKD